MSRRLGRLSHHVLPGSGATAGQEQTGTSASPMPEEALAAFIRDGFVHAQITDLPPSFHTSFGERMRGLWSAPKEGVADHGFLSLEQDLLQLLQTPTFKGMLSAILGNDFQMAAPWCNRPDQGGMIGLHITDTAGRDQQFHKDGTDHGNTQSRVSYAMSAGDSLKLMLSA